MGDTLNISYRKRFIVFFVLLASISATVVLAYPFVRSTLIPRYSISYYTYEPSRPVVSEVDTSQLPPAIAVPILMYHGVNARRDGSNTTIDMFVSQMEMLKRNGYSTISIAELELARQGKFVLPPKPIIITFDDGRKDSYYTTDDVLNKLGFKATIFVATGPTLDGNSFYLTWKELRTMRDTGRWENEAHGRYSHKVIAIDPVSRDFGGDGRYLTSKMYLPSEGRIETVAEFEKRVEEDYLNGISDLQEHVGISPHFFAIPLNDYGQQPVSNYSQAPEFNHSLIKKYFKLAFVQANNSDDVHDVVLPVYNFAGDDPYYLRRIEMKNMEPEFLLTLLTNETPLLPPLVFMPVTIAAHTYDSSLLWGTVEVRADDLYLYAPSPDQTGQILLGRSYWRDYSVEATMRRVEGRSIALVFYYRDHQNYMSFGLTDNGYFVRSTVNGATIDLLPSVVTSEAKDGFATYAVVVKNGQATCFLNGRPMFKDVAVPFEAGSTGIRVWGPATAIGALRSFEVAPETVQD